MEESQALLVSLFFELTRGQI